MSNIADFENMMSLDQPIKSSAPTRWERKQQSGCVAGSSSSSQNTVDRFIPNRAGMDRSLSHQCFGDDSMRGDDNQDPSEYAKILATTHYVEGSSASELNDSRVLAFRNKAPAPKDGYQSSLKVLYTQQAGKKTTEIVKSSRNIPSAPIRVLDAPDMLDDYYLNLLSWSSTNVLAIALAQTVYLWDATTGGIKELMTLPEDDYVSSVSWVQQGGGHLAVGTSSNTVQLWDVQASKQLRSLRGHSGRVGSLAWNGHILTSGSRDTTIINHDVRIQNNVIGTMKQHSQEVCGLAWSQDGTFLASGANDNTLCIYDQAATTAGGEASARHVLTEHQAAVKALAWCPHERNLLASGGGTADRSIKFWNAASGALVNSIDTGSQVCALQWSPFEKEILSSHGYAENQLCLWKYPTMARVKELKGHTSRVLHMATSPDGSMVCSAAADETLRFWNIFGSSGKKRSDSGVLSSAGTLSQATTNLKIR